MKNEQVLDPTLDGVEFINIYTKAATRLGRLLTNLSDLTVTHPVYGTFRTAEGLYYYLKTGKVHEELRALTGFKAKEMGRVLTAVWSDSFREDFKLGLKAKIMEHEELRNLFVSSTLPFVHYYIYSSKDPSKKPKVIVPKDQAWQMEFLEGLRQEMQNDLMARKNAK